MGEIVFRAIYEYISGAVIFFVLVPAAVIAGAYLLGILVLSLWELWKE